MDPKESAAVWLREHVVLEEDGICTSDCLWSSYAEFCHASGTQSISRSAFQLLVPSVFPGHQTRPAYIQGKRVFVYDGITYKSETIDRLTQQADLHQIINDANNGWDVVKKNNCYTLQYNTGTVVNGFPIVKMLSISKTGDMTLVVGSIEVPLHYLAIPVNIWQTTMTLKAILTVIENSKVCEGRATTKTKPGYERWINGNAEESLRQRSLKCCILLPMHTKMSMCRFCHKINVQPTSHKDHDDISHLGNETSQQDSDDQDCDLPCDDTMFQHLFPNASEELMNILRSQSKCCRSDVAGTDTRGRQWHNSVLSFALSVWSASPAAFRIMKSRMHFPSESLLQKYKNGLDKEPENNHDMLS